VLDARCSTTGTSPWAGPFGAADPLEIPIDPNGNLATKTEGTDTWAYIWNAENQLTKVEKNSVEIARFAYDPRGRRIEKVVGGLAASLTYDGGDILREVRGAVSVKYVHGPRIDEPLMSDDGTALSFFHADGLGSVAATTNSAGAVTLTRQSDAWGNLQTGSTTAGYAFTGREWDPETGLYYYRARYYDPKIGRLISEDPIGFDGGSNFYAYVEDNPVNLIDPLGLQQRQPNPQPGPAPPPHPPAQGSGQGATAPWNIAREAVRRTRTRDQAADPSNWVNHCYANCMLRGDSWPVIGPMLSSASDYIVYTDRTFPWVTREDNPWDRRANACGRWAADHGKDCAQFCESLRQEWWRQVKN
jgi:RHS repeat-associated protein